MIFRLSRLLTGIDELNKDLIINRLRHEILSRVFFFGFFSTPLVSSTTKQIERRVTCMTAQDYMIRENIELINVAGSNLVIGSKKIILWDKVDIIIPTIVKSNTGIVIADANTDVNRIYAEVSGKVR